MTTFNWSTLTNAQSLVFNPLVDILNFDSATISASNLTLSSTNPITGTTTISFGGVSVTLQTPIATLTNTNVTFQNGSQLVIGDNTTGTANDNSANTLTGTAGADQLIGLDGNDRITAGDGDDVILSFLNTGNFGTDTVDGGNGFDVFAYSPSSTNPVTVNLATHSGVSAQGNTTFANIEGINGTAGADSLTGGDAAHAVDAQGNNVGERLRGNAGNDTITGGSGNNFFTIADYANNSSAQAINVNLGTGTASDGLGGTDTLVNVDGVRGGAGADTLTGGSLERSSNGIFFEQFRGNAGNDTINGANANSDGVDASSDRADYGNNSSTQAINVNLTTGVVTDGLGGTDTLIDIDQVYGGAGNDTFLGGGSGDVFDGGAGNDTIDGAGGTDEVRYTQSTAAVIVNLSGASITVGATTVAAGTANDGMGGTDALSNIERVRGSDFNDYLRGADSNSGSGGYEQFSGDAGNDTFEGGSGDGDIASYYNTPLSLGGINATIANGSGTVNDKLGGTDTLIGIEGLRGTNSADTLTGGAGDQVFMGGGGSDNIDGGTGNDAVSYFFDPTGVTINLATGSATDGWNGPSGKLALGGTDTLVSIENAEGSRFADSITGSSDNNILWGLNGNDTIDGGAGRDVAGLSNIRSGYQVTTVAGVTTVTDIDSTNGDEGIDAITNVEFLTFEPAGGPAVDVWIGSGPIPWSMLTNGQSLVFDPTVNVLNFDSATISASNLTLSSTNPITGTTTISFGGVSVTLQTPIATLTNTNVTFQNGSQLVIGDNTTGTANDNSANTLTGTAGADQLIGLDGNDRITAGDGDDVILSFLNTGNFGTDTVDGGNGFDVFAYSPSSTNPVTVNLATHSGVSAQGNTTFANIEGINGTAGADSLTGGDAAHAVDAQGNNVGERLRGNAGNDTITGGSGNNFFTIADYANNSSAQAINVNLGTGTASDGLGGTDTLVNVDGVRGGAGADTLTGGSLERSSNGIFFEQFRGNAGNDTINGANANSDGVDASSDRADYGNNSSTQAINVNMASGTVTDGLGGTDTLADVDQVFGGAGNDTFLGGSRNDVFDGGAGNDTMDGAAGLGDEVRYQQSTAAVIVNLSGTSITVGANTVAAGTANDGMGGTDVLTNIENVRGSDFNDYLRGSDNVTLRQIFTGDAGNDTFDGGSGIDIASYGNTPLSLGGIKAFLESGAGSVNDNLGGTDTLVNIEGLAGTHAGDTLVGGIGDQWLRGNGGNDTLNGGVGSDWVFYSNSPSAVTIDLTNGYALDGWNGLAGKLALGGTDLLVNFENAEGSDYGDTILGNSGSNEIRGRAGNDTILGEGGSDIVHFSGNLADYQVTVGSANVTVTDINLSDGNDGTDTLDLVEILRFADGDNDLRNPINGTPGVDTLGGTVIADIMTGGDSNDVLDGRSGNDTIDGGAGADAMIGGRGDDTFMVDTQGDITFENVSDGLDTVTTTTSYYVYDNIENIIVAAGSGDNYISANASNNNITGNEGSNLLIGWDGNDTVNGGAGGDIIYGVLGDDVLNGDAGVDYLIAGLGNDTLDGGADADALWGEDGNDVLYGGTGLATDILVGGSGNDTLDGSASVASGAPRNAGDFDYMYGEAGDDTYYVDTPADLVFEFNGLTEGNDTVIADINGAGYYLYDGIENLTLINNTVFGVGNSLDNTITGNAQGTFLLGGAGNDTINGKEGFDILFGETGADTFVFERGTGGDVIGDFQQGQDKIKLVGVGYSSFTDLTGHTIQSGDVGALDLGAGDFIVLHNVIMANLTAADYIFA